jgi:cysteine desulfurase
MTDLRPTERDRPIYLDHNATTPVDPRVVKAMLPYFSDAYGNPSSVEHLHGNEAGHAVRRAREQVAESLGARDAEIIFTGSCTEANNMAILGAARARPERRHLITSAVEHPAVLEPFRQLEREGFELTVLGVDEFGRVSVDDVEAALRPETGLVSIMGANNEVGTVQPIAAIGAACDRNGTLFHTDLAQVIAHRRVNVVSENIHLASLSGHKAYGPKGVGALYVRSRGPRAKLLPISYGGGQERGLRSGTLNVPFIVALGEAVSIAGRECLVDSQKVEAMARDFQQQLERDISGVMFNGHPTERIPGNRSLSIDGIEPLALMHRLNGVASFSASSACASDKVETSHVLLAMFGDVPRSRQAFRVSPGRFTAARQLADFADALIQEVAFLRQYAA